MFFLGIFFRGRLPIFPASLLLFEMADVDRIWCKENTFYERTGWVWAVVLTYVVLLLRNTSKSAICLYTLPFQKQTSIYKRGRVKNLSLLLSGWKVLPRIERKWLRILETKLANEVCYFYKKDFPQTQMHHLHHAPHCSFLLNLTQYAVSEGKAICSFNEVTVSHQVYIVALQGFFSCHILEFWESLRCRGVLETNFH